MRIPDCRTDEYYNQKYLNANDKAELVGYDWCAEEVVDNFFNNIEDAFERDSYFGHALYEKIPEDMQEEYDMIFSFGKEAPTEEHRKCETYADLFRMQLLEWIENERDEMITSMIDNMNDEEYEANKAEVDKKEE
jgi:hypothetical protein